MMGRKTKELILYRGIAVDKEIAEVVKENILHQGIKGDEGRWRIEMNNLRSKLKTLFNKPDLTTDDTRPSIVIERPHGMTRRLIDGFPVICACGDQIGASYYALIHNRHRNKDEIPYVIKFLVPISSVYIDGRDFLYLCFQFWDRKSSNFVDLQTRWLSKIYGKKIIKYFKKAISSKNQNYRIAMYDLASQDLQVIEDHAKNQILIKGRHNTIFCSAFFVRVPILPSQIISVEEPTTFVNFEPEITLDDFIEGRLSNVI